ncbi:LiaF transmembrane domain-containing protein [Anaerocolumna sp. MB42-C2]|uniref:LiaF transmembrane domain-containing protein n=1 Tax=Anaerocolumna sp. MB42-C2 TaxID=3070997 RepID=UPI0027DFDDBF|nr:LiaF domain-containing protein [Anaerocolumna sp. MB42-C2]WMJ85956.1 LiaF-related protein [Anaerocolumna sp. MB42-C2]
MKNTMSKAVWGVFFVLLGVALAGRAVGVFNFNLFFPGWWTLFIIIPSAIGLVNSENRVSSVFGLGVGILLLCSVQRIIDWYTFPRLMIALIFISIGCSILFRKERRGHDDYGRDNTTYYETDNNHDNGYNTNADYNQNSSNYSSNNNQGTNNRGYNQYFCLLSGRNVQFINEEFTGAVVTSILGNVQMDLRNAFINDDIVIETTCLLGGVDIYVPNNVKVTIHCTPILGGVENKVITPYPATDNTHTIYIKGTCILGGIEVR